MIYGENHGRLWKEGTKQLAASLLLDRLGSGLAGRLLLLLGLGFGLDGIHLGLLGSVFLHLGSLHLLLERRHAILVIDDVAVTDGVLVLLLLFLGARLSHKRIASLVDL